MPPPAQPGTQPACVPELAVAIGRAPARLGRTRLVCIDGPAGSGKTSLAAALHTHLAAHTAAGDINTVNTLSPVATVHMDDLYRGWDTDFDEVHQRVRRQLVEPLSQERAGRYQVYDWHAGRFDAWVEVPVPDVLLLEGVASGSPALDPVMSMLVWIEADRAARIRRGVCRDGAAVLPRWLAWMEHEAVEHARQRTRARAHLRLLGDGPTERLTPLP